MDEFMIALPVDQEVSFYMYSYVASSNTYTRTEDVEGEPPVRVYVY